MTTGVALLDKPTVSRDEPPALARLVSELLADAPGWSVELDEFWAHARTTRQPPAQGWKLHVSATLVSVVDMVRACVPLLVDAECQFKVARDLLQVEWLTHPYCPRENAGKILTAYPADAPTRKPRRSSSMISS